MNIFSLPVKIYSVPNLLHLRFRLQHLKPFNLIFKKDSNRFSAYKTSFPSNRPSLYDALPVSKALEASSFPAFSFLNFIAIWNPIWFFLIFTKKKRNEKYQKFHLSFIWACY